MDPDQFQIVREKHYPKRFDPKCIEYCLDYKPDKLDRILLSYPKSGTVWVSYIIRSILSMGAIWTQPPIDVYEYLLLFNGQKVFETNRRELGLGRADGPGVRFMFSHTLDLLLDADCTQTKIESINVFNNTNTNTKYLLVIRNPKDVFVSYFNFLQTWKRFSKDIHQLFDDWLNTGIWPGDYFEMTRQIWQRRHQHNCTVIVYERLLADTSAGIELIADFLGPEYRQRLTQSCNNGRDGETLLDAIIRETTLKSMKMRAQSAPEEAIDSTKHFRKGRSGDWRSVLTRPESDAIDERCRRQWLGTGLEGLWEQEMKY